MTSKTIVGRLGDVPQVRSANGKPVAVFSVAETKRKFDRDQQKWVDDFTLWHNVESWRNTNVLSMLPKGTLVVVVGEERDGSYEKDGRRVPRVVVRAAEVGQVLLDQHDAPAPAVDEPWATPSGDQPWGGTW